MAAGLTLAGALPAQADPANPPVFTSASNATGIVGSAATFTVQTTGSPAAAITETGALPTGVGFTDNSNGSATIAGTPAAGTAGEYPLTFTATSTSGTATQAFTLIIDQRPAITSAATATFPAGVSSSFLFTTSGYPAMISGGVAGALPTGLGLVNNGDGTVTLSGTPAIGTGGDYPLTVTAGNGVSPDAVQNFVLTVSEPPAFTTTASATLTVGQAGSFGIVTTGFPAAGIVESGALPSGVTLVDNGDGTATLSGTPAAGASGIYPLTLTASNGALPDATQPFTLTVNGPPVITSAASTTFGVGTSSSFTVTTTSGLPLGTTLSESGALPSGVSFVDNGDGTATLSGTPAAGTGGVYPLTLTASNGPGSTSTQAFTLTVASDPAFTSSATASFTRGVAGTFTVTTGPAFPAVTSIAETGTLPAGLTFTDNGDGTATIAGTTLDTASVVTLTLTASNGSGPDATQSFSLMVADAPVVALPPTLPTSDGAVGGVPATVQSGDRLTLTGAGFAPDAPVTFGIYSSPTVLATVTADASGTATATVTIPAGLTGAHTLAAAGIGPDGQPRYLLTATLLPDPAAGATGSTGTLADTGLPDLVVPALLALFALLAGASIIAIRRRSAHS